MNAINRDYYTKNSVVNPAMNEKNNKLIIKFQASKEFIKEHNLSLEDSYGYGDTINDLPMLMICEHKYAVDPNKKLLQDPLIKELEIVDWTK